jgi:hypothetical protein
VRNGQPHKGPILPKNTLRIFCMMVQLDELLKNCHGCEVVDFPIASGSLLVDSLKSAPRLIFSLIMSTLQRTDYHCVLWLSCCWYGSTTNPVGITPDLPWFTQLLLKLDCTIVHWTSEHLIKKTNVASCTVLYSVGTRTLRSHKCKCLFDWLWGFRFHIHQVSCKKKWVG